MNLLRAGCLYTSGTDGGQSVVKRVASEIERQIAAAVEAEREACAMVAEAVADEWNEKLDAAPQETILREREAVGRVAGRILGARRIAIAIRSRGKTEPPVEETT